MAVIIVGAGIGGLTTALALARRGISCVVIERAGRLDEVGAGLQLSPNACRVLFALGLEAEVRAIGFAPESVQVASAATGHVLLENGLGAFAEDRWGAPYLQIRRSDLQAVLVRAIEGVDLRFGCELAAISQNNGGVTALLKGGQVVEGEALIGCDGLNSAVRAALWGERAARFTGQTAWRGLARADDLPAALRGAAQVWAGPGRHFVHYPVGCGLVNMVAVVEDAGFRNEAWDEHGDRAALTAAFSDWPESVRAVVDAVEAPWRSALFDRPPLPRWSKGSTTLLGDAAHPMLPFLAQGAAMAIEDAAALADALCGGGDVPRALTAYEALRRPRTAKVQAWAMRNAALFHLPAPALEASFGAAKLMDRIAGKPGEARFDWLYGYGT